MGVDDPPDLGLKPGDVLGGRYRVERVIGSGGMGVVVAAHHLLLDERVALKFLRPDAVRDPEAVARFIREARAAVRIKSEHVARVTDVGQLDSGLPFMVMEYLEGRDLAVWLEEKGPLPPEQVVELVLQACEAMAEAHGLGIVHRDLKPSNLFRIRRADGRASVKVLDFGISKLTGPRSDASVTRSDTIVGSPAFMSPEQMTASKQVDARTDIWSLGVILFQLLTGRLPFDGEAATQLAIQIAMAPPLPLRGLRPEVSPGLERVVMRCLQKDRALRFQDVGELAKALEPHGPERSKAAVDRVLATVEAAGTVPPSSREPSTGPGAAEPEAPTLTMHAWGQTGTAAKKKRVRNAMMGLGLVAAMAAGIVLLARNRIAPPTPSTSASAAVPLAAPPLPPPASTPAFVEPTLSATPPTVSPTDLPRAPPLVMGAGSGRLAPSRATGSPASPPSPVSPPPAVSASPATKPAYNPLEHL